MITSEFNLHFFGQMFPEGKFKNEQHQTFPTLNQRVDAIERNGLVHYVVIKYDSQSRIFKSIYKNFEILWLFTRTFLPKPKKRKNPEMLFSFTKG